jgi:ectoine hydroxylase-related dioxygenase (phytanoyl-CoA dioxygenase family)
MEQLIGEPAAVHLNLTGWVTTRRNWHQDTYLNPSHVGDYYVAIWIALEDIHPDSGPFQFVRGSHRWPTVTREKILNALDPSERDHTWPKHSERLLTPLFEAEIEKRNAEVITYLPKRGDVLFWHGRLLHRGSEPNVPGMQRKSLIAHYSGVNHRQDMPTALPHGSGWYFPIDGGNVQ